MEENKLKYNLIADDLEKYLKRYDFTVQEIIDSGVSKQQVYSVFRRGKTSLIDYRINTLFKVIDAIEKIIYIKKGKKVNINVNISF